MERRVDDDLSVAIECNTEGWPDEPDAWAQVLARVWEHERWVRQEDEATQVRLVDWRLWDERGRLMAREVYPAMGQFDWSGWWLLAPGTYYVTESCMRRFRWQEVRRILDR